MFLHYKKVLTPGFVCMQEARFKHYLFEGECDFSSLDVWPVQNVLCESAVACWDVSPVIVKRTSSTYSLLFAKLVFFFFTLVVWLKIHHNQKLVDWIWKKKSPLKAEQVKTG